MSNTDQKKISFIVPLYNGQEYIDRCVESILKQEQFDTDSIEVLLLDDESKDNTLRIASDYAEQFPGIIKVYSHKNMGVANTRNRGIELATGKYIAFVDQDDYLDRDFCSVLYASAVEGDYDVVFSGMKRPDENGKIVSRDTYKNTEFARLMCMSIWAKLHKTDFIRKHEIKVFNNKQGEDIAFTFMEYQKTDKIIGLSYVGYNWFYNRESVSNTSQRQLTENNVSAIIRLQNRLFEIDTKRSRTTTFFITMLSAYYIFFSGKGSTYEQFIQGEKRIIGNLKKHRPDFIHNPYLFIAPRGILPIFSVGLKCYIILHRFNLIKIFARFYCKGDK